YVLDKNLKPLPIWGIGELYIGGAGISRGYLNLSELTLERFIDNPFQSDKDKMLGKNSKLYKTGDLVRWLPDGNLEYIGRNDYQVKIRGYRIELGEIEDKLCQLKEIKQAIVCCQNHIDNLGLTNSQDLVAYYVLDNKYSDCELNSYLESWLEVYDNVYADLNLEDYKYNTCGWNSSYTSKPIPKVEMKDLIDNTVSRIVSLNPKNILEIGCGSGLILFNILNICDKYIATDFSSTSIEHLNNIITKQDLEYKYKVDTICCSAHELGNINFEYQVDTVIINSVVQYFPNIEYLINILELSISKIGKKGKIFLGDIRDYRLLKLFHFSILSYQNMSVNVDLIDEYSMQDTELLVSPNFFIYCKTLFNRIKHVDILPKIGSYNNEMNRFRYDVVLYIDDEVPQETCKIQPIYYNDIKSVLENTNAEEIFISYINIRIFNDYKEYNKLLDKHIDLPYTELLTIEEIYLLAAKYNYKLKILLDVDNSILLNLIFYRDKLENYHSDSITLINNLKMFDVANNPIQRVGLSDNALAELFEKYLLTQLPEYMVPNHYIKLPNVPLTLNGKVDYKALPPIKFFNEHTYVYPRTELEEKMVIIWSDILGIPKEQIGIEDNFFKLGGNSLLVVRLKKRLSIFEEFKQVTVVDIFKYTTIQQLTSFVMNKVNSTPSIKLINNSSYNNLDIAVIGISGAFSGGEDLEDFWEQINFDKCGLIRHTIDECRNSGIAEELLNHPDFIPVTGKIVGTNEFDSIFWEMQADEIHRLDPQVRKFLEHSWYVLESSGYLIDRAAINIGVFAGGRNSPCLYNNKPQFVGQVLGKLGAAGELNTQSSLAMQVSYILGLTGISTNVNTACSTSLVAIVEACKNLVAGYCDMAIAGGVSLILPSEYGYIYQNGGIFSKNGESRIFDANSSGMISGSGVGVVLLKPLEKAIEDKDNIIAVIKGYHINNDGTRKMSYTSPSVMGQVECIVNAQKIAGVSFDEIDYVECHGTGTQLGDAVEIQALNEAFNYNHTPNATFKKCYIGSVKANIGHAELASGVAGIIKVCKMLEHNVIPKQINFDTLNPNIPKNTPFIIPKSKQQWLRRGLRPRIAGVSSFGIGGTNAHLIISDYVSEDCIKNITPQSIPLGSVSEFNKSYRLPLSAKSKLSLEKYKKCFIDFLKTTKYDLSDIAYTLQLKREVYQYRSSVVANSISEAIEKFENNITITNVVNKNEVQNIIFMFPGQGSQYANMTLDLYQNNNEYKVILDNCISITNSLLGISFENILFPANQDDADTINQTQFAQLALFCVSYSIAKLLESLDVKSSAYLGHSIGELVAATLCGVFDLRDAIKLVIKRGKLMQSMQPGSMLLIQFDKDQLNKIICQNNCEVAVINSPQQFVVSGNPDDILKLKTQLDKELIPTTILKVSHGYHSYLMEDAANKFIDQFKVIKLYSPKRLFISNVTGDFIKPEDAVSPEYWSKHIRQKVLFMDGVKSISRYFTNPFFIQVGPGKELLTFVNQTYVKTVNSVALIDKNPDISNKYSKEEILNKLWLHGYKVNSAKYFDTNKFNKTVNLPNYSFDNQTYIFKGDHVAINNASLIRKSEKDPINRVLEANLPQLYYDIAKIFLELLMVDKISIHDNFFDLGGNSITSLSLITKLKNIGINLSLTDIININSIAKIYKFAHHSNSKIQDKIVVPLLVNNQRKKVFFIHPIGGTVIKYLKIIDRLKNQYDYYGIQNINISNINTIKVESLQELCSIYLEEILKIQDNGEYIFMGSSVGGNIAFEIARQLIQLGKTVKYIVMLDSWAKYFDKSDYPDKNIPALEESSYINHKNLKEFVSNTTYANLMGAGNNLLQLIFRYQPKKVDVKIYLCKANKLNPKHIKVENSWDNFWQKYTDIPVTVYNISGDHDTIFSNPGFSEILESINSIL
ncbi:MAG: beta-ketoacyl synthase N-terminal-like domain-containing protein, partial [Neisseriaceae bacterium]